MADSLPFSDFKGSKERTDEECLLRVFPEEIWLRILENLSLASRESLYSQPFFHRLLLPTRHIFLFPRVWKVFATKVETELLPSYYKRGEEGEASRIVKPIVGIVKSARLVCKDWCREIDNFYDNLERRRDFRDFDKDDRRRVGDWIQFNEFDYTNVAGFLRHFQSTHAATERNPFLGRRLSLNLDRILSIVREIRYDVGQVLTELFGGYGSHIWYLEVITDREFLHAGACYAFMKQWLSFTPNLKSFKWSLTDRDMYGGIENLPDYLINRLSQRSLFPRLKHLKLLHLGVPQILAEHLITVNNHVEVIEYCVPIKWQIMMLPRLKKLRLLRGCVEDLEGLDGGRCKNWKLEALRLDLNDERPYIPYERILSTVEIWKDSLVTVELSLPAARTRGELQEAFESLRGARSSLRRVKTFKLAVRNILGIEYAFPETGGGDKQRSIQWKAYEGFKMYTDQREEVVQCQVIHFSWDAGTTSETFGIEGWKNFPTMGDIIGVQIPDMDLLE